MYFSVLFVAVNKNRAIVLFRYCIRFPLEEGIFLKVEFRLRAIQAVTLGLGALTSHREKEKKGTTILFFSNSCVLLPQFLAGQIYKKYVIDMGSPTKQ